MSRPKTNYRSRSMLVAAVSLFLTWAQVYGLASQAQSRPSGKKSALGGDLRIAHVLSRLTFGARPGDFERVKSIGVDEFIRQQLDPDSLDDGALLAKLEKLKTLGMATPLIIEQYTPPKPVASPSLTPALPAEKKLAESTPQIESDKTDKMSAPAMQNEMPAGAKKEEAGMMAQLPSATPKPTPT